MPLLRAAGEPVPAPRALTLWLVYGFWRGEVPLIAANGATLMLASVILYFKIRHG